MRERSRRSRIDVGHASADRCAIREIEFMGSAADRVVFDGGGYVESRLLEAEAHPARSGEEIDA
jgi:hypothetical protein